MNPERFKKLTRALDRRQPDLTVLMEFVNKEHNFSAILRSCDAVGALRAHAVSPPGGLGLHHHTSAGAKKWVEVQEYNTIEEAARALHADGFQLVAAHVSEEAVDYRALDYLRPTAFMVGAELFGISEAGLQIADRIVAIPQEGMVQSLNVSVATALLLYEARRQREEAGFYRESRLTPEERARILFEWAYPRIATLYRKEGRPYPELDEEGGIVDSGESPLAI